MNPYAVLGLSPSASRDDAKAAYRRLAQKHHPDRGGDEEKFKEVKAAYELIEGGWTAPPPPAPPPRSSMSDPKPTSSFSKPAPAPVKPAPGYEARNRAPAYPTATRIGSYSSREFEVTLDISQSQADYGCTVPFRCDGKLLEHWVQPGSSPYSTVCTFPTETVIGRGRVGDCYTVRVNLSIQGVGIPRGDRWS